MYLENYGRAVDYAQKNSTSITEGVVC